MIRHWKLTVAIIGALALTGTTVPVRDLIMVHAGAARSRAW
jgi:hypothetical protein